MDDVKHQQISVDQGTVTLPASMKPQEGDLIPPDVVGTKRVDELPIKADDRHEEGDRNIRFNPPMSIQRYKKVVKYLNHKEFDNQLVKMVDFGCSDMTFLKFAKRVSGVRELSVVDIDGDVLERFSERAAPLVADFIFRRSKPLTVTVYQGDLVQRDERLRGYDAVTAIELIEHLHEDVLDRVPAALFGFIRPKVVVLTTPNADFNVLFTANKLRFRHWDHKFEWNRIEFGNWCEAVVRQFPAYSFTLHGIGNGPIGSEDLGRCSQMAVFRLIDDSYREDPSWLNVDGVTAAAASPYVQVCQHDHPCRAKPTPETLLCDLLYYVRLIGQRDEDEYPPDEPVDIAIQDLLLIPKLMKLFRTEEAIRQILSSTVAAQVCSSQECALVSKDDGRDYIRYRRRLQETSSDDDIEEANIASETNKTIASE